MLFFVHCTEIGIFWTKSQFRYSNPTTHKTKQRNNKPGSDATPVSQIKSNNDATITETTSTTKRITT